VELLTGLAEKTPMTARGGSPFHEQVTDLRRKLAATLGPPAPERDG
jgi:hypothetical protein